jgi:hypothetical protein
MLNTKLLGNVQTKTRSFTFYLLDNGSVCKVNGITDTHKTGQSFIGVKSFYSKLISSKSINIYKVSGLGNSRVWSIKKLKISAKCWVMKANNGCQKT